MSRQREWQLRRIAEGKCIICGGACEVSARAKGGYRQRCEEHRVKDLAIQARGRERRRVKEQQKSFNNFADPLKFIKNMAE